MNLKIGLIIGGIVAALFGGVYFVYNKYLKPTESFLDEYKNAQKHIHNIDSLLQISNRKIDSSLSELGKIKDSISTVQVAQKASNKTVNDAMAKMQTDLKKYYGNLNSGKASLKEKNHKKDSLERELDKLKP